jgi:ribosome biogenesis ATPase
LNGIQNRNNIYVVAATNRPDILDNAILRSGRLEMKLEVTLPTA